METQAILDEATRLTPESRLNSQSRRLEILRQTLTDLERNHAALRAELHGLGTGKPRLWRRFWNWMSKPVW